MSAGELERCDVAVVGGGPVGLYLGAELTERGMDCRVLESRRAPAPHSRSIGIHPPALGRLARLGLDERLKEEAVAIRRGHAIGERGRLGTVRFDRCPPPFPYILAIPQHRTESVLARFLEERARGVLWRGYRVTACRAEGPETRLSWQGPSGESGELRCRVVVGCDGKDSLVRKAMGGTFRGGPYPDRYVMGDFEDNTDLGADAAVYLPREGLIESFPLPHGRRRWVVKTDTRNEPPDRAVIDEAVRAWLGHELDSAACHMTSAFGVGRYLAAPMAGPGWALAGDAAHIVSPIGGQGMNLGWLDAAELAERLARAGPRTQRRQRELAAYNR
ncbi:MAG: FAD-dependent oxidoreductase, partial [Thiohalorhabdus sp.]|uniref:FAD-dependent oxidoreductase n=1 Tax=Thiohalorhabdus sp. TaxID=3094134 RepID=UPI0039810ECD